MNDYERRLKLWLAIKAANKPKVNFYESREWQNLRYEVLRKSKGCCELCGDKNTLQVDHIKPRSKYPELELDISNLQVLCRPCNMGKGARDETDWRAPPKAIPAAIKKPCKPLSEMTPVEKQRALGKFYAKAAVQLKERLGEAEWNNDTQEETRLMQVYLRIMRRLKKYAIEEAA
jgi:hypothetical protein